MQIGIGNKHDVLFNKQIKNLLFVAVKQQEKHVVSQVEPVTNWQTMKQESRKCIWGWRGNDGLIRTS